MKRKLLICSSLLATAKECFAIPKLKSRNIAASSSPRRRLLFVTTKRFATAEEKTHCNEEQNELNTFFMFVTAKPSFVVAKGFAMTKQHFALVKEEHIK